MTGPIDQFDPAGQGTSPWKSLLIVALIVGGILIVSALAGSR